jgi:hypothetical protein
MPKQIINYANISIYKIICNDVTVTDCYVGSTSNFTKRKSSHKSMCTNIKNNNYNSNVYKKIRGSGGWDNWSMVEIEKYPCKDNIEATLRERHWILLLGCTLNTVIPNPLFKEETQVKSSSYFCAMCDYSCPRKDTFSRHLSSQKHSKNQKILDVKNKKIFPCLTCDKEYKHRQSLHIHTKTCTQINSVPVSIEKNDETSELKYLILEMVKTNTELQKQMLEVCKGSNNQIITNNNILNTSNSHNKTFNLQIFLNDTCKNAMNLTDFVSSLQIDLEDLESVGELGFVNGLSKLIISGLNDLEECERPVHCSDLKRESMYVKEDNKWEKEDAENTKMKKALKQISHKNIKMLPVWKTKNPDYKRSESYLSDKYSHMVIEAMGGSGDNDEEKANKIIRKIAKEVTIKKQI